MGADLAVFSGLGAAENQAESTRQQRSTATLASCLRGHAAPHLGGENGRKARTLTFTGQRQGNVRAEEELGQKTLTDP